MAESYYSDEVPEEYTMTVPEAARRTNLPDGLIYRANKLGILNPCRCIDRGNCYLFNEGELLMFRSAVDHYGYAPKALLKKKDGKHVLEAEKEKIISYMLGRQEEQENVVDSIALITDGLEMISRGMKAQLAGEINDSKRRYQEAAKEREAVLLQRMEDMQNEYEAKIKKMKSESEEGTNYLKRIFGK